MVPDLFYTLTYFTLTNISLEESILPGYLIFLWHVHHAEGRRVVEL